MKVPIYIVDAFTPELFRGNPAAVCIFNDLSFPDSTSLQKIAKEMNLSETAFTVPIDVENGKFKLRWFTPTVEVNMCGHATLATAHILFTEGGKDSQVPKITKDLLSFETLSGILTVQKLDNGKLRLNFPQGNPIKVSLSEQAINQLSDFLPIEKSQIEDVFHCQSTRKLLIEVKNYETIEKLRPNFENIQKIDFGSIVVKGVIVTTKGPRSEKFKEHDFVSRYFAPWAGINEDPVTGSAHTVLTVYWAKKLGKKSMLAFQASERGGELNVEITEDGRVLMDGFAVTFLSGSIEML